MITGASKVVLYVDDQDRAKDFWTKTMNPHSNLMFHCDDLEETYRELSGRGVEFPQPPVEQPWGWWSMFEETDGTRYALGRRGD